jgi:formyl-CoA transferase
MSLCPYSVYPTRDGYLAIICSNDNHWRLLAEAMGRPELGHDARYAKMSDRAARLEEVDGLVAAWSSTFDKEALFAKLLAHRVPTAPVRRLREVLADPHLRERGMLFDIDHPEYGRMVACRSPLNIDGAPQPAYRPSAALGADNESVYRGIFGLDAGTYEALLARGVI